MSRVGRVTLPAGVRIVRVEAIDDDDVRVAHEIQRAALDDVGRGDEADPVRLADTSDEEPCLWLVYDGDHPIAFAVLVQRTGVWAGWYLRMAAVRPDYQGRGLQRRLLDARIRYAKRHGAREVLTYTRADNAESMRALMRARFVPYRETRAGYAQAGFVYWRRPL